MLRRFGAIMSVMALLLGFVAAPYTHVHQSAHGLSDAHDHARQAPLLHTHPTPHAGDSDSHHAPVEGAHDAEQKTWSVAGFVFQPATTAHAPMPALPVYPVTYIVFVRSWEGVTFTQPGAHAPPLIAGSNLRGPPFVPATIS